MHYTFHLSLIICPFFFGQLSIMCKLQFSLFNFVILACVCMRCYLCLRRITKLSFCTLGWASSRTDSTSCSHSCCPKERWWFWEEWRDIRCSKIETFLSRPCCWLYNLVFILLFILYSVFEIDSDGWEGKGTEGKAWFGQGEER
jgi:hypothetical protein